MKCVKPASADRMITSTGNQWQGRPIPGDGLIVTPTGLSSYTVSGPIVHMG